MVGARPPPPTTSAASPSAADPVVQEATDALVGHMEFFVLDPKVFVKAVEKVLATLAPDPAALQVQRTTLKTQITATEREPANLTVAIASTGPLPTLLESIQDREQALAALRASLTQVDRHEQLAALDVATLQAQLEAKVADYRS